MPKAEVINADSPSKRAPVGVITDRDIVVQVVAQRLDLARWQYVT